MTDIIIPPTKRPHIWWIIVLAILISISYMGYRSDHSPTSACTPGEPSVICNSTGYSTINTNGGGQQ